MHLWHSGGECEREESMSYVFDSLCTMTIVLLLTSLQPFQNSMTFQFPGYSIF